MLVETGVPGFLFFYGSVIFAILLCARKYLADPSDRGAFAGGLSCSLIAFLVYSTVLSQVENFTLLFLFLGLTFVLLDRQSEKT
jgi:O-antigen ligase